MSRLLIAILLLLAVAAHAQTGTWTALSPGPTPVAPGRYSCADNYNCTSLSNRATTYPKSFSSSIYGTPSGQATIYYFGGGHGDNSGNDVELYNIATNTWTQQYQPEPYPSCCSAWPTSCANTSPTALSPITGCSPFDGVTCWYGPCDDHVDGGGSYTWTYPAGRPWAHHVYATTAYDAAQQKFVHMDDRAGVSVFDPVAHVWSSAYSRPSGFISAHLATRHVLYDPTIGTQLLDSYPLGNEASPVVKTWNWTTHALTTHGTMAATFYTDGTGEVYSAYDPVRHRHLVSHRGSSRMAWYWYDATSGTPPNAGTWTDITSSAPSMAMPSIDSGPGFDYDTAHDRFVVTLISPTGPPYTMQTWTLDPSTNTWAPVSTNTMTGIGAGTGNWGMFHYDTVGHQFIFTDTGGVSGANGATSTGSVVDYTFVLDGNTVTPTIPGTATATPTITPTATRTPTATITPTETIAPTSCPIYTPIQVGPSRTYKAPCNALGDGVTQASVVRDCSVVEIDSVPCSTTADCTAAGFAANTASCIDSVCAYLSTSACQGARWPILCSGCSANAVTVRSAGGPVIVDANGWSPSGTGIWRIDGNNAVIDGITFQCEIYQTIAECHGQRVGDDPGAGIRLVGSGLTVRNATFRYNDDGILTGTSKNGLIDIQNSQFYRNGHGITNGQTHAAYLSANTLIFRGNYMHSNDADASGASGHYLKSRSAVNYVEGNRFMDLADGHASFETDFPDGGLVYVIGNLYEKGPQQDNTTFVSFHREHQNPANPIQELYFLYNSMANDTGIGTTYIAVDGGSTVVARDNIMWGSGTPFTCSNTGTYGPCTSTINTNVTVDPLFVNQFEYDYHLGVGSPAIGAATAPGSSPEGYSLAPTIQYVYDHQYMPRLTTTDSGGLEVSSQPPCLTDADCPAGPPHSVCIIPTPIP